jgi:hypothetical protein
MHDAYRYEVREVDYDFKSVNPFKGAPIQDIEKEWTYLMNGGKETLIFPLRYRETNRSTLAHTLRVPEAEMKKADISSIQVNDGSGDYLAVPIVRNLLLAKADVKCSLTSSIRVTTCFTAYTTSIATPILISTAKTRAGQNG